VNLRYLATLVLLLAGVACFGYAIVRGRKTTAPTRDELRGWRYGYAGDAAIDDSGWRDPDDTWVEQLQAQPDRSPWSAPNRTAYGDDETWVADMTREIQRWRLGIEADLRQFRREQCGPLPSKAESAI
jgi:hypothetical protein